MFFTAYGFRVNALYPSKVLHTYGNQGNTKHTLSPPTAPLSRLLTRKRQQSETHWIYYGRVLFAGPRVVSTHVLIFGSCKIPSNSTSSPSRLQPPAEVLDVLQLSALFTWRFVTTKPGRRLSWRIVDLPLCLYSLRIPFALPPSLLEFVDASVTETPPTVPGLLEVETELTEFAWFSFPAKCRALCLDAATSVSVSSGTCPIPSWSPSLEVSSSCSPSWVVFKTAAGALVLCARAKTEDAGFP